MPPPSMQPGDLVGGRYITDSRILDAGLGEAWAVHERSKLARPLMLKLLGVGGPGDPSDPHSLPALAARMQRIDHPSVLPFRGWGEHDGRVFALYDRVEGRGLARWFEGHRHAGTRPGLWLVQRVIDRVGEALQASGEVHGALSPASVFLRREATGACNVKVLDFGASDLLVATTGEAPVEARWRAPEQLAGGAESNVRTDVFALARMLVEALDPTQAVELEGTSMWARLALDDARLRGALVALRGDVPSPVWDVVATGLAGDPSRRFATPGELRGMLQQAWRKAGLWEKPSVLPEVEPPEVAATEGSAGELPRTRFEAPQAPLTIPMGTVAFAGGASSPAVVAAPATLPVSSTATISVTRPTEDDRTALDVPLPPPDSAAGDFTDESTPPDGGAVLSTRAGPMGFRMGSRLSAPPAAEAQPRQSHLRARTLGAEEFYREERPSYGDADPPEGTNLIEREGWDEAAMRQPASSGDPFFSTHPSGPPAEHALERTKAIDLSASGVTMASPAPPQVQWGMAPSQPTAPPPPGPPPDLTWWIVGGVSVVAIVLAMIVVIARA